MLVMYVLHNSGIELMMMMLHCTVKMARPRLTKCNLPVTDLSFFFFPLSFTGPEVFFFCETSAAVYVLFTVTRFITIYGMALAQQWNSLHSFISFVIILIV